MIQICHFHLRHIQEWSGGASGTDLSLQELWGREEHVFMQFSWWLCPAKSKEQSREGGQVSGSPRCAAGEEPFLKRAVGVDISSVEKFNHFQ